MTSKGQVTIPKALRQQLALARGSRFSFQLVDDHIEVPLQALAGGGHERVWPAQNRAPAHTGRLRPGQPAAVWHWNWNGCCGVTTVFR
jgi:AbrB family looped-hinge helix DNA binding protein